VLRQDLQWMPDSEDNLPQPPALSFISVLREGDEIIQGKAVQFETGVDPTSGKTKAVSVDLT
jgi:hypothetical protein